MTLAIFDKDLQFSKTKVSNPVSREKRRYVKH